MAQPFCHNLSQTKLEKELKVRDKNNICNKRELNTIQHKILIKYYEASHYFMVRKKKVIYSLILYDSLTAPLLQCLQQQMQADLWSFGQHLECSKHPHPGNISADHAAFIIILISGKGQNKCSSKVKACVLELVYFCTKAQTLRIYTSCIMFEVYSRVMPQDELHCGEFLNVTDE